MTVSALKTLRRDLQYHIRPVPGFFIKPADIQLGLKDIGTVAGVEQADYDLPLYHTTFIGKSSSCDIRIKSSRLAKRHALIYRYDGDWFIKPVNSKSSVILNGIRILPATPLEHGDLILLENYSFIFTDERKLNIAPRLRRQETQEQMDFESKRNNKIAISWLAVNLFALISGWLILQLIPQGLIAVSYSVSMFYIVIIAIFNLYYFLMPLLLKELDRSMILIGYLLTMIGIAFQIRLSGILDSKVLNASAQAADGIIPTELAQLAQTILADLKPQGIAYLLGLIVLPLIVLISARTRLLEPLTLLCAVFTPALLIATLIFGRGSETHGASLWISFGGTSIQLTEFAKITYLIVLAGFFKIRPTRLVQFMFAIWAGMVFLLVLLLPDLGMAMILLPTTLLVYLVMTSEYMTTIAIMLSGSAMATVAFAAFPHVQRRLAGWTTLWQEVNDSNRQIVYGLQAVARGGLFGRGIANGSPGGLPLASSDMVYAIICEEMGLAAGMAIIALFIILWLRAARITVIAQDGFTSSLALAIGTMFFVEAAVVIAGVIGLIPLTGVTLPLIAEGGSSVLSKLILLSILIGLSARRDRGAR